MASISCSERPDDASMRIDCSLPVALSLARDREDAVGVDVERDLDLRQPARRRRDAVEVEAADACGCRRAIERSPWSTWISTDGWLSLAVENVSDFRVGIVVLAGISAVMTPPSVSMPRLSGVTSSSSTSVTSPERTPPWMAAPTATTSSGLTDLFGLLAEELLDDLLHLRDARRAADEDDLVDLAPSSARRP